MTTPATALPPGSSLALLGAFPLPSGARYELHKIKTGGGDAVALYMISANGSKHHIVVHKSAIGAIAAMLTSAAASDGPREMVLDGGDTVIRGYRFRATRKRNGYVRLSHEDAGNGTLSFFVTELSDLVDVLNKVPTTKP